MITSSDRVHDPLVQLRTRSQRLTRDFVAEQGWVVPGSVEVSRPRLFLSVHCLEKVGSVSIQELNLDFGICFNSETKILDFWTGFD